MTTRVAACIAGYIVPLVGLVLSVTACATPGDSPTLETVEAPPDLAQLDLAVREQFVPLWRDVESSTSTGDASTSAEAWGALGRWFDVYDYADSAARCYRNALRLDPREPRWPYHLGVLEAVAGEHEAARDHLAAAASLAPDEPAPRARLGDLALERQDLDRAAELYESVLAQDPDHPGALLGEGRLALLRGDAEAALEPLERLVRRQPEASQARYSLSLAWRQLGDDEKADAHLAEVPADNLDQIALDLGSPWDLELARFDRGARTLTRRGIRAFRRGDHGQAARLLGAAVAADPEGVEKRINYALALRRTGHVHDAREQLETALGLAEPRSELEARSHVELGRLLAAIGRPAVAVDHLEAALAIDPDSLTARLELGRLHQVLGRPEAALGHYAAARDGDRPVPDTCFWHAAMLMVLDRHDEARQALEADVERLGDDRPVRLLFARLLSAAPEPPPSDIDRARRLLAAVAEGDTPPDVLYAETAAMVAAASGDFAAAVAWQRAAIDALDDLRRRAAHVARRRLVLYEEAEPCTTPWEAAEAIITLPVSPPAAEDRS